MKFSVITISHNSAETIRNTFDSVLMQTYSDIEYIVIDGASADFTITFCYYRKGPAKRIFVFL